MTVKRADTHETLVDAFRGHDALVISLAADSPPEYQTKLIAAAAEAGVAWILPNEYGSDTAHPKVRENPLVGLKAGYLRQIEQLGKAWIAVVNGQWYDYSMANAHYAIDMVKRTATIYDDGNEKTITTTLAQSGRAIAALLSLPVSGASPCLTDYKNKHFYVESFELTQNEMLAAAQRATGTSDKDWTVEHKPTEGAVQAGLERFQKGDFYGLLDTIYVPNWIPSYGSNYKVTKGTANRALGLPTEDLDEVTKYAYEKAKTGGI